MAQIIDASVALKWFVEEEGRDRALDVLKRVLDKPGQFAVPELFFFELAHVFHRLIPDPTETQERLLLLVNTLGIHRFAMNPDLLVETRRFQKMGLSGYDAAYVGLAKLLRGKWLTFDKHAHRVIGRLGLSQLL